MLSINLIGCNDNKNENKVIDNTNISREVTIQNKEALYEQLVSYIKGTAEPETFYFDPMDITLGAEVNNHYYFNGSVYIQISNYMYRFQLENDTVTSYIKYNLEG